MTNTVARAQEQIVFVVEEATKGTAVFPTEAAEMVITAGAAEINQQPSFTDSEEIADTLDTLERFQDQIGAGSWSIPLYIRPSGTAGTAPMGKALFESLMGLETIVGATSVTYAQAKIKPSFTIWMKKGHTVFFGTGACAENGKFEFVNKGASKVDFSGGFMQMGYAGTSAVTAAVSASTTVPVTNGKLFTAGGYVQIGSDTNTLAGYKIASVSGNNLTMVDEITCDDASVIKGYIPTYTGVGTPLENKNLSITFAGSAKNIKSLSLDISSPVEWQDTEITSSGYVTEYVEAKRTLTVSAEVLFREQDLAYFYDAINNTQIAVVAVNSGGAGSICTVNLPYTELEVPSVQSSPPTVSLLIAGTALGSSGEDSGTIVFT